MTVKKPYAKTNLPGGIDKLIQVCEDLRDVNTDGYMHGSGLLAHIKNAGSVTLATVCSPFTATAIGLALDPNYAPPTGKPDQYLPMFNGGADPLPWQEFYHDHNGINRAAESLPDFNLGTMIEFGKLRRGDVLGIDWTMGYGHTSFVWDVHVDKNGEVDAVQVLGSHGEQFGVHIHGCARAKSAKDPGWLKGKTGGEAGVGKGTLEKVNGKGTKIFVDSVDIVRWGAWYVVPGKKLANVDLTTFKAKPLSIADFNVPPKQAGWYWTSFKELKASRFHLEKPPPDGFANIGSEGGSVSSSSSSSSDAAASTPAATPGNPPGHVDVPSTVVPKADVQADPEAAKKIAPKPAAQDEKKPVDWQKWIEEALQIFFKAGWLKSDPGDSASVNDAKSKAAIKEFQKLFPPLDVDGIAGPKTRTAMMVELPIAIAFTPVQILLGKLFEGKKIKSNPGPATGTTNPATQAAIEELQKLVGLAVNGIAGSETVKKLTEMIDAAAASDSQHGMNPILTGLYWLGNVVAPGASAVLRLHSADVKIGQELKIFLKDAKSGKEIAAAEKMVVSAMQSEVQVAIPAAFALGSSIVARVEAAIEGGKKLALPAPAPLYVDNSTPAAATAPASTAPVTGKPPETITANWRPYIGKDSLPDEVISAITKNRALYPKVNLVLVPKGDKYYGPLHYDYKPSEAHKKWATKYFQDKVDSKAPPSVAANRGFVHMLTNEGYPASFQTYDNEIITWGAGLGGIGNGVHAFENLSKDPAMKKLLDDIGINYDKNYYRVVDTVQKKVISSDEPTKAVPIDKDIRNVTPLEAVRRQPDLMYAIIGMSEDPNTQVAVAESQYKVYLSNSASWPGQEGIASDALFFFIAHMFAWRPAYAKYGFDAQKAFKKLGASSASTDTDVKLAPILVNQFVRYAMSKLGKDSYAFYDIWDRTRRHMWEQYVSDAKKEKFSPGSLTYESDIPDLSNSEWAKKDAEAAAAKKKKK